jgi:hypothetical protein
MGYLAGVGEPDADGADRFRFFVRVLRVVCVVRVSVSQRIYRQRLERRP